MPGKAKVILRFHKPRSQLDGEIRLVDRPIKWDARNLAELKGYLPNIEKVEGKYKVKGDFDGLSVRLGIDKAELYRKLVELYYEETRDDKAQAGSVVEDTINREAGPIREQPGIRQEKDGTGQEKDGIQQEKAGIRQEQTDTTQSSDPVIRQLEQLKLGKGATVLTPGKPHAGYELSDSESEASVINMASASVYLHGTQLMDTHGDYEDPDDSLLYSGSSLRDSVLEEELLDQI